MDGCLKYLRNRITHCVEGVKAAPKTGELIYLEAALPGITS